MPGLIAAQRGQGPGEDERHALERSAPGARGCIGELQAGGAQPVHQLPVARFLEEFDHRLRYLGSHLVGHLQIVQTGRGDGGHAGESLRQKDGGAFADEADAERREHTRQRIFPGVVDVADHVGGALVPHANQLRQVFDLEAVEVRHVLHDSAVHQLIYQGVAHAIDVHDAARREVEDRFLQPRRTIGVDAAASGFSLLAHHLAAADRAFRRHVERLPVRALGADAHHLRDHVARTLHHHFIADLQSEPLDFIFVMQRGAGDRDAADFHRFQTRHRSERAGAAYLHLNGFDRGDGLARRVFVGDGPARRLGGVAELTLLRDGIHLHHHAIDFVWQVCAPRFPSGAEREHFLHVAANLAVRVHLKPHAAQFLERLPVAVERRMAFDEQQVGMVFEAPRGGNPRLQNAQRSGGGVTRIGEARQPLLVAFRVQPFERAAAHHGFAAHLQGREVSLDA